MKVFLASALYRGFGEWVVGSYVLESFYYIKPQYREWIPKCKDFLLDSGAFSFMTAKKNEAVDFDSYVSRYIEFINDNNIRHFFELDIDSVAGLERAEAYRRRIESGTGRQCIPVWHKSRGIDYFKGMCRDYDYISIGGIASGEIRRSEFGSLVPMVNYAHTHDCRIHGLGFAHFAWLRKIHWDSVDTTSWMNGARYSQYFNFDSRTGKMVDSRPMDRRVKEGKPKHLDRRNFGEWLKFQKWAECNL